MRRPFFLFVWTKFGSLLRQGCIGGERCLSVRIHASVQGTPRALHQVQGPWFRHHRFPLQPIRWSRTWKRWRDRTVLFPKLWSQLPHNGQGTNILYSLSLMLRLVCLLIHTHLLLFKVEVNGDHVHPVYQYLKSAKSGIFGLTRIKWNFEKFLIDKQGQVVDRYSSLTTPASLEPEIEKLLA